jgi:molybdate transport system substrate-binding protein
VIRRSGLFLSIAVLIAACGGSGVASPTSPAAATRAASKEPVTLTVFGAASLKAVLSDSATAYQAAYPGTTITFSTDSSSALETQIEQGAPADVFLSADTTNPQKLIDGGFASGNAVPFAGNKLTIVVPKSNPGNVTKVSDLARTGLRIIAAGDEVPITRYANQLVSNLAADPSFPSGFVAIYTADVVSKEDNVKAIIAKIELGEGDAAIVYVTDAKASTKVTTVDVPNSANVPATYAGVVVKASKNAAPAAAFLAWFAGPDGQAILAKDGFLPPPS